MLGNLTWSSFKFGLHLLEAAYSAYRSVNVIVALTVGANIGGKTKITRKLLKDISTEDFYAALESNRLPQETQMVKNAIVNRLTTKCLISKNCFNKHRHG